MDHPDDTTDEAGGFRKPFAAVLQELNGQIHDELGEKLAECVTSSLEHEKQSTLTLTLTVIPQADGCTVQLRPDVKHKPVEAPRKTTTMFADEGGNLGRSNPAQPELPVRELPNGGGFIAEVATADGTVVDINRATGEVIGG